MEPYTFIDTSKALEAFGQENKGIEWMCFDTEFVGEKRYYTLLCVIQIKTIHGNYVIDPIKLKNIDVVLGFLADPNIVKITHAGENDYRLLSRQYDMTPTNTFDTQIAAAFLGYKYPVSFQKLVGSELGISLKKGYTVTNWEARPLSKQQIGYALDDVLPLYDMWQNMKQRLEERGRLAWAREEFEALERSARYEKDPYDEALKSSLMRKANQQEKIFLLRLYNWRTSEAERKNYSKEMILSSKLIGHITKGMRSGKNALKGNRRLPDKIVDRYWSTFESLYQKPASEEELRVLKRFKKQGKEDPQKDLLYEILYSVIKYKCLDEGIDVSIAFPRADLKLIKEDVSHADVVFNAGWRQSFFGKTFNNWLKNSPHLQIDIGPDSIELSMNGHE